MRRTPVRPLLAAAALVGAALLALRPEPADASATSALPVAAWAPPGGWPPPPAKATVVSVYDGDTFTLDTGDKIRLRWVNTPELKPEEPLARDARAFTESFVMGREVTLFTSADPRDGYGRIVAGITTDQGDLSLALVEEGLAHVFLIPPEEGNIPALLAAQDRARAASRGLWSLSAFQGPLHITSFHANGSGDDDADPNGEYLRICNIAAGPVSLAGFTLRNRAGDAYPLPPVTVPAGYTVKVHSGRGAHQQDPRRQITAYLGADRGIWDNEAEVVEIVDPNGAVVDFRASGKAD